MLGLSVARVTKFLPFEIASMHFFASACEAKGNVCSGSFNYYPNSHNLSPKFSNFLLLSICWLAGQLLATEFLTELQKLFAYPECEFTIIFPLLYLRIVITIIFLNIWITVPIIFFNLWITVPIIFLYLRIGVPIRFFNLRIGVLLPSVKLALDKSNQG